MQRIQIDGIPYWKDAQANLYYYEGAPAPTAETGIRIGTQAGGLAADWRERVAPRLAAYRESLAERARPAAGAPSATPAKN